LGGGEGSSFFRPKFPVIFPIQGAPKNQEGSALGMGLDLSEIASTYQFCLFSHAGGQAWVGRSRDAATGQLF
jgi:hypothetical protein